MHLWNVFLRPVHQPSCGMYWVWRNHSRSESIRSVGMVSASMCSASLVLVCLCTMWLVCSREILVGSSLIWSGYLFCVMMPMLLLGDLFLCAMVSIICLSLFIVYLQMPMICSSNALSLPPLVRLAMVLLLFSCFLCVLKFSSMRLPV